jgi:hypothetical protein
MCKEDIIGNKKAQNFIKIVNKIKDRKLNEVKMLHITPHYKCSTAYFRNITSIALPVRQLLPLIYPHVFHHQFFFSVVST